MRKNQSRKASEAAALVCSVLSMSLHAEARICEAIYMFRYRVFVWTVGWTVVNRERMREKTSERVKLIVLVIIKKIKKIQSYYLISSLFGF